MCVSEVILLFFIIFEKRLSINRAYNVGSRKTVLKNDQHTSSQDYHIFGESFLFGNIVFSSRWAPFVLLFTLLLGWIVTPLAAITKSLQG